MPTITDLRNLGRELRGRRLALGRKSLAKFAAEIGVSRQHLSHIENAYVHPSRGPTIPSDDVLQKVSAGYGVPLSRISALLGRTPDIPIPAFSDPEALRLAERYDRLPARLRAAALAAFAAIERLAED